MMNGGDVYELAKILGHSNIKMTERYARLARQHIARTGSTAREIWKLMGIEECRTSERRLRTFGYCSVDRSCVFLAFAKCFGMWWPGTDLNRRRQPFQGCALPTELPGQGGDAALTAAPPV